MIIIELDLLDGDRPVVVAVCGYLEGVRLRKFIKDAAQWCALAETEFDAEQEAV